MEKKELLEGILELDTLYRQLYNRIKSSYE